VAAPEPAMESAQSGIQTTPAEPIAPPAEAQATPEILPPSSRETREAPPPPAREPQPRAPMAIQQAIEEVNHIIDTLRATLDDMDEVLETLELAERQKTADEHEINTLRRGLHKLHRPREGGQHGPRHGAS
jgi:hypothetical protein